MEDSVSTSCERSAGGCCVFLLLHNKNCVNEPVDLFFIHDALHGQADNNTFNPVFANSLLVAILQALRTAAFVIIVHSAGMALAAFTNHHALTFAAEQLCCQQIVLFGFCHCGSMAVLLRAFLHTVEQFFRNDSRNAALNYNILIAILANLFAVFQQRAETIDIERLSLFRSESTDIEIFHNGTNRFAVSILLKYLNH